MSITKNNFYQCLSVNLKKREFILEEKKKDYAYFQTICRKFSSINWLVESGKEIKLWNCVGNSMDSYLLGRFGRKEDELSFP